MTEVPKVRSIDGVEPMLEMIDKLRESIVAGEVTGLAYATANRNGAAGFAYEWGTRHGDRHLLSAAISLLWHRFMCGYEDES